jgi:outer membrane protein
MMNTKSIKNKVLGMVKWVLPFYLFTFLPFSAVAQSEAPAPQQAAFKFGFLSYDAVLQSMPEYADFQASMTQLREKYEAEQKRVENDFNKKYEEFLDGQASYPQTILQKRQSELQEMLSKNIAFKKESLQLLSKAEAEAKAPLQEKLAAALAKIGQERGLAFILNTDVNAVPWLNIELGENLTEAVKELLK